MPQSILDRPTLKIDGSRNRRCRFLRRSALWLVLAALPVTMASLMALSTASPLSAQTAGQPQEGTVKAQHGDWQVICKPPPAGAKNGICALVQAVTAEDRKNVGLTVYFQRFADGTKVLRIFAPLGILLPRGIGLKIDDQDIGNAPFLRCHSFACYAQVTVDDKLIEKLKVGQTAIFIIFQTEEAGIGIPVSLSGFSKALSDL